MKHLASILVSRLYLLLALVHIVNLFYEKNVNEKNLFFTITIY